jgi:hypothetical protein
MKFRFFAAVVFLFLFTSKSLFAQLEKANYHFDNFHYAQAIPLYIKAAKKEKTKIVATQKLADCYRILHDYRNAEMQYAQVIKNGGNLPIHHLYYGQMLFNNGHVNSAKEQFDLFSKASGEDKRAQNLMSSIIITRLWSVKQREYDILNVRDLNTEGAEFCAIPYNKNIVFVSDRGTDLVNYSKSSIDNRPYLSLFLAERGKGKDSTKFKKIENFSGKINNEYHNGPATFVESGKQIFFTRVDRKVYAKKSEQTNRPRIYYATQIKDSWDLIRPLQYNSDAYSVAHPAISADGMTLIFSSDMPGGFGGKDLYICKLEGANWSKPVNLGAKINSVQDEVFPYLHKNGTLYFSSDGHVGFGGLDIYSARYINNEWCEVKNMQEPINSTYDDFGINFLFKHANGYFASNRPGGVGGDDIYSFELKKKLPVITAISGKIFRNELDAAQNIEIKLTDETGLVLETTKTDSLGVFKFERLNPEEDYIVMLDADEVGLGTKEATQFHGRLFYNEDMPANKAKLVIKNKEGVWIKEMETDQAGYFRFDYLEYEKNNLDTITDPDVAFVKKELFKYQQLTTDNIIPDNLNEEETIAKLKKLFKYDELLATTTALNTEENADTEFYVKGNFVYNKLRTDSFALNTLAEDATKLYLKNKFVYNKLTGDSFALKTEEEIADRFYVKNGYRYDKLNGDSIGLSMLYADNDKFYVKENFRYNKLTGDSISLDLLTEEDVDFDVNSYTLKMRLFTGADFKNIAPGVKVTIKDGNGVVYKETLTDNNGELKVNFLPINRTYVIKVDQDNDVIQQNDNYSTFGRVMNSNSTKFPIKGKEISFANMANILFANSITDDEGFFKLNGKTEKRNALNLIAHQQDSINGLALSDEALRRKQEQIKLNKINNTSDNLTAEQLADEALRRKKEEERMKLVKLSNTTDKLTALEITDDDILKLYGNKTVRDLTFTTQVAAYKMSKNFAFQKIQQKFGTVKEQKLDDGITRFTVQSHATINSADSVRQLLIKEGVKDAFVTAIYKGKRYLLRDLIAMGIFNAGEAAYFKAVDGTNAEIPKEEKTDIVKPIENKTIAETKTEENTTTNVSGTAVVENKVSENKTKTSTASKTKEADKLKLPADIEKLVDEYGDIITDKVEYRVQVGAFKLITSSYQYKRLEEVGKIDKKEYQDGIVRYTIGHCETLREANKIRRQVVKVGVQDAFVVVVHKGNRYTVYEAIRKGVVKK